jgi:hypothetical protein
VSSASSPDRKASLSSNSKGTNPERTEERIGSFVPAQNSIKGGSDSTTRKDSQR